MDKLTLSSFDRQMDVIAQGAVSGTSARCWIVIVQMMRSATGPMQVRESCHRWWQGQVLFLPLSKGCYMHGCQAVHTEQKEIIAFLKHQASGTLKPSSSSCVQPAAPAPQRRPDARRMPRRHACQSQSQLLLDVP
mmetsp:Transcript_125559/g.217399  ORF Transcript_125559/g.217399 Transcript_125559/m.217399 type:complete len:135 (+) Transcript_125559:988-1392(+)